MFAKNKACAEVNRLKLTGDQVDKSILKVDAPKEENIESFH